MLTQPYNFCTKLKAILYIVLGMLLTGCDHSEPFSWSVAQAKSRKTLICEVTIAPSEIVFDNKRIVFGPAWLERCPEGDFAICFQLEKGNDIFKVNPRPFFVLDDRHDSFSERVGSDLLQFIERIDDPDIAKLRATLMRDWSDEYLKNIHFIPKSKN
jgi:hypothetical protein